MMEASEGQFARWNSAAHGAACIPPGRVAALKWALAFRSTCLVCSRKLLAHSPNIRALSRVYDKQAATRFDGE